MQNKGQLYLIPTPLSSNSNQQSVVEEVRGVLGKLKYFLVEDLRTARRYISSLDLGVEIDSLEFYPLTKRSERLEIEKLMQPLHHGTSIGVMSEAGCPGIADPGAMAVSIAHEWNIKVMPLVGASSVMLALMGSGFNGQQFCFHGYLPLKKDGLSKKIRSIEESSRKNQQTEIFIEAPYRNNQLLKELINQCHSNTFLCIGKDLTGENEWIKTQTIANWEKKLPDLHKIPVIFLLQAG